MVEKPSIKNLSSCSSKSYASVVLSDSFEVTFLGDEDDVAFCPFLHCILFIDSIA